MLFTKSTENMRVASLAKLLLLCITVADLVIWSPNGDNYIVVFGNKIEVYLTEVSLFTFYELHTFFYFHHEALKKTILCKKNPPGIICNMNLFSLLKYKVFFFLTELLNVL